MAGATMAARAMTCLCVVLAACAARPPQLSIEDQLALGVRSLAEGRLEDAIEIGRDLAQRAPRHVEAARFRSLLAELRWQDGDAIREQALAIRIARAEGVAEAELAALRGRLGDLLFQAGRFGESVEPLLAGAHGAAAERRRAFAAVAAALPFTRRFSGPVLTEQPLLPGDLPEFVGGPGGRLRPFAVDTGTSMTTVTRSFADELGVLTRRPAGAARDSAGRDLPVEVGLLPQFHVGDVEIGTLPVLVVDEQALALRDGHGGPVRSPRGVLGLDVLASCRLTLDHERQSIVLELPRGLPEGAAVPCVRAEGRCLVPVIVEGVRLWFALDTGASHSSLSESGVRRLPGGTSRAVASFRRVRTVGGSAVSVREVRDLVLRCADARFVDVALPVVARGDAGVFPVHGVLGIDLLSRCRVTIDTGRARLTP